MTQTGLWRSAMDKLVILFDHENAFEEMYCICCMVLNRTFDALEATYMDFGLVLKEVRRQLEDVLASKTQTVANFRKAAFMLSHTKKRKAKDIREEEHVDSEGVKAMKEEVMKYAFKTVKEQRVSLLSEGCEFKIPGLKGKYRWIMYNPEKKDFSFEAPQDEPKSDPKYTLASGRCHFFLINSRQFLSLQ